MLLDGQGLEVDPLEIGGAAADVQDPALEPRLEALARARLLPVLAVEGVVALEEPLHGRWMRAARLGYDRDHLRLGEQDPVRVAERDRLVLQLLTRDDHALRREPGLLGDAERAPGVRAAGGIAP